MPVRLRCSSSYSIPLISVDTSHFRHRGFFTTTRGFQAEDKNSLQGPNSGRLDQLVLGLRTLDTASLCDAASAHSSVLRSQDTTSAPSDTSNTDSAPSAVTVSLISGMIPITTYSKEQNNSGSNRIMAGVATTVSCRVANDFLAVLQGLNKAQSGQVLVVTTPSTTHRALAGELFFTEATRRGLAGLVVQGPMRDVVAIRSQYQQEQQQAYSKGSSSFSSCWCFCQSITPYAGTTKELGDVQVPVRLNDTLIVPGRTILVGDEDGLLAFSSSDDNSDDETTPGTEFLDVMESIIDKAQQIQATEARIKAQLIQAMTTKDSNSSESTSSSTLSLHSMTNFEEHIEARKQGRTDSTLQFKP